ncbi:terminase large subunit domain-containing protein [Lysinibacillus parviboronicapiens]|uniref:terminase large subunit domain-containing protein n=2 Tax=Lysinibacillus parviboronicapiens TaxID=436516 RepID=UPI000D3722E6|nr:terminase large subunit [Lysinibacillus parviboronicapiens]
MMITKKSNVHIENYIAAVRSGEVVVSKDIVALIELVEKKLMQENVWIDENAIEEAIESIEKYFPFKLFIWQKFVITCMFGLFYDDNSLVFNEFLLYMGRGAGKNAFLAALAFHMCGKQGIRGYNIDIVATSEKQAKTSFNDLHDVLEDHWKTFKKHFKKTLQVIRHIKTKSEVSFYTNNAKTKDGFRPGVVVFDEIHAYETEDNIKVFTSGLGKVPRARRIYLTTDGNVRDGFLDQMKEEAEQVLLGEISNSRLFPFICRLDDPEEVNDKRMWEKANPSLMHLPDLMLEMELEYDRMQNRPSAKIEFMTKRMNQPSQLSADGVADWDKIVATNRPLPDLKGAECIGGIDYADTRDFVGVGLLFKKDGKRYWKHHTFINHRSLKLFNYAVDIELAKEQGLVTIIYEETNKPEIIAAWFAEQSKYYRIKKIASDLMRINHLREVFQSYGFSLDIARSGTVTHTKLQPTIEEMFAYENIIWGNDLMMRWYTRNTYVQPDGKGNITYEKIEPKMRKTDGFFALLHALQFELEIAETSTITPENVAKAFKTYSY